MNPQFKHIILDSTKADDFRELDLIQELWSGYGVIKRLELQGSDITRVVIKHVRMPDDTDHPRGWNTDLSHQRKVKSYQVETAWYKDFSHQCDTNCYVPQCFACETIGDETLIVLEDLDAAGFSARKRSVTLKEINVVLRWLAHFHATFMGTTPDGLWEVGTYWHLDTRPDELKALDDKALKEAAPVIDSRLNSCAFKTIVHGDAKLANFCFTQDGTDVAAVDFQYVGGGCGMKDVAYFLGSCLHEDDCHRFEEELLRFYFQELRSALRIKHADVDREALEREWRALYPLCWTDFHRFIKGWSPGHWKINDHSEHVKRKVLDSL